MILIDIDWRARFSLSLSKDAIRLPITCHVNISSSIFFSLHHFLFPFLYPKIKRKNQCLMPKVESSTRSLSNNLGWRNQLAKRVAPKLVFRSAQNAITCGFQEISWAPRIFTRGSYRVAIPVRIDYQTSRELSSNKD